MTIETYSGEDGVMTLKYGIIGGGFITGFQLRALKEVRGVEVAGLTSRTPPEQLARYVRESGLGDGTVYRSIAEMAPNVDVVCIFGPNFTRIETVEQIVDAVRKGAKLKGLICEKPLGRNMQEARRLIELVEPLGIPTCFFENQPHMKAVAATRAQLAPVIAAMGPPVLVRAGEEHAGPHAGWFWDPAQQGGGVMSDMGCHCLAVGWYLLTPPGRPPRFLEPQSIMADLSLLKWGQPRWRDVLKQTFGVDYAKTPAEDFATGMVTFRNPDTGQKVKAQFSTSWMYDKSAMRLSYDGIGPGYAFEMSTLRSPLEVFIGDAAAEGIADAESALEKSTATRGLLPVQPNEPDLYGYVAENQDAVAAFTTGSDPLLDWRYGLDIVRLTMAAYLSDERGTVIDLTDPATQRELEEYVPLIQQGRGVEVL
ncbi:MAG: Gfo/Idh/MocA family protein [Planctomycetaceae bacterium]